MSSLSLEKVLILKRALDQYFANIETTRSLACSLIDEHKYPREVLLLLCSRLDALASEAFPQENSKKAFTKFVASYSGKKTFFESVSLGDLHYELDYHRWRLEGTITSPGRLNSFSKIDEPIIHLLDEAGLPLTVSDSAKLLDTLIKILKRNFRVVPGQPRSKRRITTVPELTQVVVSGIRKTRLQSIAENLPAALEPLAESKKVGTILYSDFRCESVHGSSIRLDTKQFFTEHEIYWKALHSRYYGPFEVMEFPAKFLLALLERCVRTYREHLLAKGKLPPDVHFGAFPDDVYAELDLLDADLLPEIRRARLKVDR